MQFEPVDKIYTPHKTKEECPIQPVYSSEAEGRVEVFEEYAAGLKDIETFSHLYLLYLFDRAGKIQLIRPTFLDDEPHGIYASRHPCRPNSIGMSIVRLEERQNNLVKGTFVPSVPNYTIPSIKQSLPKRPLLCYRTLRPVGPNIDKTLTMMIL